MIPLYSDKPLTRLPFVTILLVAGNIAVFWHQLTSGYSWAESLNTSVYRYGMIPADIFGGIAGIENRLPAVATLFTSMFMHGGLMHLGSNMLYLWVFGRNIEDDFGHIRFLLFYLVSGFLATLAFAGAFPHSTIPLVGASGAIAGILGAYFLRFPGSRIHTIVIFIIFIRIVSIPAFVMLGFWFAIQIASCMVSCMTPEGAAGQGGVAWISHVAGFVAGIIMTIYELRRRYIQRRMGR